MRLSNLLSVRGGEYRIEAFQLVNPFSHKDLTSQGSRNGITDERLSIPSEDQNLQTVAQFPLNRMFKTFARSMFR